MLRIVSIVEGHGEVIALPVLLRRIFAEIAPQLSLEVFKPIRVSASRFLRDQAELERDLTYAISAAGQDGYVLVLLDCDDELPCIAGPALTTRIFTTRPDRRVYSSLAYREFESWLIAGIEPLAGSRSFPPAITCPTNFENTRDAKGWLTDHMTGSSVYSETVDQPSLTARFDMNLARQRSRSFARFWRICEEIAARAQAT